MIIRIEFLEDNDGFSCIAGTIEESDFNKIIDGTYSKPFIKLDSVFWTYSKKAKEQWEEDTEELIRLGHGERANFVGSKYVRVDRIMLMSPLKSVALNDGTTTTKK